MATSPLSLALSQPTSSGGGGSKWARILGAGLTGASFLPQLGGNPQIKNAMLAGGLGMLGTGSGWGALAGVPSLMFGGGGQPRDNSDISVNGGPATYPSMYGPGLPDLEPQGPWDRPESTAPGYQLPEMMGPGLEQAPSAWKVPGAAKPKPTTPPKARSAWAPSTPPAAAAPAPAPVAPPARTPLPNQGTDAGVAAIQKARGIGPNNPGFFSRFSGPWDLVMPSKWGQFGR